MKFKLGLFEQNVTDVARAVLLNGNVESKEVAKQIALESITLLKNENNILPLSKKTKTILVTERLRIVKDTSAEGGHCHGLQLMKMSYNVRLF